jgi:hypothetical protein
MEKKLPEEIGTANYQTSSLTKQRFDCTPCRFIGDKLNLQILCCILNCLGMGNQN